MTCLICGMDVHHYEDPEVPLSFVCQEEYADLPDSQNISTSDFTRAWLGLVPKRKGSKFEKVITVVLLVALLLALIAWGVFSYNHIRQNSDSNFKKINELTTKYDALQQKYQRLLVGNAEQKKFTSSTVTQQKSQQESSRQKKDKLIPTVSAQRFPMQTKRQRIIMNLVGDGSLIEMKAGQPINDWESKPLVKEGEITFYKQTYIQIEADGLYLLQARMFLKGNGGEEDILSYTISKRVHRIETKSLVAAAVPSSSCKTACTLPVSTMVHLKAKEMLYLEVTGSKSVKFRMLPDKSSFSCLLLMASKKNKR